MVNQPNKSSEGGAVMAHVYIQEGGSSRERYLKAFDTLKDAKKGRRSDAKAAYRTTEITEMDDRTNWDEVDTLLNSLDTLGYP